MADNSNWRELMGDDRYAALTGIEVVEARPGFAKTRLQLAEKHLNGHGRIQGGVIFTLADYTSALASNMAGIPNTAVTANISYLRGVWGEGVLTAEGKVLKAGRRASFISVDVLNGEGKLVATFQSNTMTVEGVQPILTPEGGIDTITK